MGTAMDGKRLGQALYQSIWREDWSDMHESLKISVQEVSSVEGWAKDCWFGQIGVAEVRQGNFLFAEKRLVSCLQQEMGTARFPFWKPGTWTYTKHLRICEKIGKYKSKPLKLHTLRVTEWMTPGLVCCLFPLKIVSSSHRCLLSSTIVNDEFALPCPALDA